MRCTKFAALAFCALSIFLSCVTTGPDGKKSFVLMSDAEEVAIGKDVDADIRAMNKVYPDTAWARYINEVGQRVVKVCDRQNIEYHFNVIESDQINAFATPGGYVYFYTGILRMMESESEMAAVMAHEVSHVVARHSAKHLQAALGASIIASIALGRHSEELIGQITGIIIGLSLTGYGRSHELEADQFGLVYMTRAGYNPGGARSMFAKLAELSGGKGGVFEKLTSSHPDTQERIAKIDAQIAAMPRTVDGLPDHKKRYEVLRKRLPPPAPADSTKK